MLEGSTCSGKVARAGAGTLAVPAKQTDHLRITMVGHATLLIQAAGVNILTDPVWSERASPFSFAGPRRVTAPGIAFDALPPIDVVLISHNHYDHLDFTTLQRLQAAYRPLMVMPLGNDVLVRQGVPEARIVTGDWGSRLPVGQSATVTLTPANHWSSRSLRDRRMALWSGFWIETASGTVWFAGDTGYGDGVIFHDIHGRYGSPDVAVIPIGAYTPRTLARMHETPKLKSFITPAPDQKKPKNPADLAIAAIAIAEGAIIATGNQAHFEEIHGSFPLTGLYNPFTDTWSVSHRDRVVGHDFELCKPDPADDES